MSDPSSKHIIVNAVLEFLPSLGRTRANELADDILASLARAGFTITAKSTMRTQRPGEMRPA